MGSGRIIVLMGVIRNAHQEEVIMDFIERLLGISPDGGDGSTELMYLTVLAFVVVAFVWRNGIRDLINRMRR
jgi:hypothetical protein